MNIQKLIEDPTQLTEKTLDELRELVYKYPYYQTALLLYLTNLFQLRHPDFGKVLRRRSIFLADRRALFQMAESAQYDLPGTHNPADSIETESDVKRTLSLIDNYLTQNRQDTATAPSQPSLTDLTHDYTAFLETLDDLPSAEPSAPHTAEANPLAGSDLIDSFIQHAQGRQRLEMQELDEDYKSPVISYEQEEVYTENMVNIYIKQGRYKEAVEILRRICLNNPKKNATFAAEIQLLEVILGEKG